MTRESMENAGQNDNNIQIDIANTELDNCLTEPIHLGWSGWVLTKILINIRVQ
jgi:poly-D-alanine transfer protein DltD